MTSILKSLAEHKGRSSTKYRKTAIEFGDANHSGLEPRIDGEAILAILAPCGKSAEEFQADIAKYEKRLAAAADLAKADAIPAKIKELQAEQAKLQANVNAVAVEYQRKLAEAEAPLGAVVAEIRRLRMEETNLKIPAIQYLCKTASPNIDTRRQEIGQQIEAARAEAAPLRHAIAAQADRLQERIKNFEALEAKHKRMHREDDPELTDGREKAQAARVRLAEFEQYRLRIAEADLHIAELEELARTVEQDKLDPRQISFFPGEDSEDFAAEVDHE